MIVADIGWTMSYLDLCFGTDADESLLACHFQQLNMVGVAKRPKAPDCGSGIRGFESHHPPQKIRRLLSTDFLTIFTLTGKQYYCIMFSG